MNFERHPIARSAWGRWAFILLIAGCPRRSEKYWVERIEWGAPPPPQSFPLSEDEIHRQFVQKIEQSPFFRLAKQGESVPKGAKLVRLAVELDFSREDEGHGFSQRIAAAISVRRKSEEGWAHYESFGSGESKETGAIAEGRRDAARRALGDALTDVIASAGLQLTEFDKPDRQVIRDLKDPKLRNAAISALADRKNPAAVDPLLEKLKLDDPYEVRRAMGGLVALREPRAVPLLIDVARGKDWGFLRELLFAIGEIGGEEAEAYLYTVAQGHDQPAIRAAAQQALDELAARAKREASDGSVKAGNARRAP